MSLSDQRPKATQATPGHRKIRRIRPKKPETLDFARKTRAQYGFFCSLLEENRGPASMTGSNSVMARPMEG
jgi:hypothetical protein